MGKNPIRFHCIEIMNETSTYMKNGSDESGRTHEELNVTPRESSQGKGYGDDMKSETTSLKRIRDLNNAEASDSSLDDHNDGVPSTDTSATNLGAPVGESGGVSDQMRLEERRAYNRRNAARSRQRVKDQLRDLQQQVIAHTTSRSELERTNVRLLAENNVLRDEVHKLRTILSGAPLFGQQQQTLQPFLQQPFGIGPNAQFMAQGGSTQQPTNRQFPSLMEPSATQPTSQLMLPNVAPHQQQQQHNPFNFYPPSNQNQMQQEPAPSTQSFTNQAGDGSNNQNAVVQMLLQQIMNNNNNNNAAATQLPNNTGTQEPTLQLQPQQLQQQQQQQQPLPQDNSFAAFMAFVGGGGNAAAPSTADGKASESQQASVSMGSLSNDAQQQSSSTQTSYGLIPQQQQQFDVQELQQSFLSQQQQQPYAIKEDGNTDE